MLFEDYELFNIGTEHGSLPLLEACVPSTDRHPVVVEHVLGREPQLGLRAQHVGDEVDGPGRHALPVRRGELQPRRQDRVEQLLLVAVRRRERREPAQQDVEDHARRPHVDLENE